MTTENELPVGTANDLAEALSNAYTIYSTSHRISMRTVMDALSIVCAASYTTSMYSVCGRLKEDAPTECMKHASHFTRDLMERILALLTDPSLYTMVKKELDYATQ